MDKPEDAAIKRILGDESFEPSADDERAAALVRHFEVRRKKSLVRAAWWVIVGMVIFFAGSWVLGKAVDTRGMVAAAVIMVVGFETTVLIKLWYWTIDSKIAVLRELKRAQLLALGESPDGGAEPEAPAQVSAVRAPSFWDRLGMKALGRISQVVIVLIAVLGALFVFPKISFYSRVTPYRSECHAVVSADGAVSMTARIRDEYCGVTPTDIVDVPTGEALQDVSWRDAHGNILVHEVQQAEDGVHYKVRLPRTVYRGETIEIRATWTESGVLQSKGALSVFSGSPVWRRGMYVRYPLTVYDTSLRGVRWSMRSTLMLPAEAKLESVDGRPYMTWRDGDHENRWVISYEDPNKTSAEREMRVTFRMPAAAEEGAQ